MDVIEGNSLDVLLEVSVRDPETGEYVLTDPATVRLHIKKPGALSATTYTHGATAEAVEIAKEGVGRYCATVLFNMPGKWRLQYQTTAPDAVKELTVRVDRQRTRA
jgi:hypothetical protein